MERPTWQEVTQWFGMPAAKDFESSILLAQLQIARQRDRNMIRQVFHTTYDEVE